MRYRRARQTAWRTIADETVLLDLERKQMFGLNPAGARVWLALEAADDLDELARLAAGEARPAFDAAEVGEFLEELMSLGLAEERGPAAEPPPSGPLPDLGDPEKAEPPKVLWREQVEQIAGTCAMFPSTSPICDQAPFS